MKRNTRLNLFLRLLIAAGVSPLLVVAVQALLGKAFVANVTDVGALSRVLALVNDEMTFRSELHVTKAARMISNIFVNHSDML